jgi:hypothetical protein
MNPDARSSRRILGIRLSFRSEILSGEPPLQTVFHLDLIWMLRALRKLFHLDWLRILQMVFCPALQILLHPSI